MKFNKLSILLMSCLSVGTFGVCNACTPAEVVVESIALNKNTTSIWLGSSETLTVTFTPDNTSNKEVVWSSEDDTIASVANGVVTANKVGKTVIKATSVKNNEISASCEVTVTDTVTLSGVDEKHEFTVYNNNKTSTDDDAGFYDHNQSYKVGDDNPFNVKPILRVVDAQTFLPASASDWNYDFVISATTNGQPAGSEYFSVVDARECDVQFTSQAVGKTFTISVAPGGVDQTRAAALTKTIDVEVVDGYNVYDAKELAYFDTRSANDTIDNHIMEGDVTWQCKWTEFKTNNGLRNNYYPASLIFQTDITVTPNDMPSNFFYSEAEAAALGDKKAANSLRDWMYIYERTIPGNVTIDGNYFDLDFSAIPLIKRERFKETAEGDVVGHAAVFKLITGGDVTVRNVNMTGNAQKATNDAEKIFGGGVMFVKGSGVETFKAYNVIATKFFITFMGEKPYIDGNPFTKFDLEKVKCFNNYNSFMYNWGSTITAKDSFFRSCGGPVIIQDHVGTDTYESLYGLVVDGYAPTTNFVDCTIKNYVNGSEAWFQQFNATLLTPRIKAMSDWFYGTGLTKSFIVNDKEEGKVFQTMEGNKAFFNFVVLNKSGDAEGITEFPACGTVNFVETNKTTTFNYRMPDSTDPVGQAYVAYATASNENKQAAFMALIGEMMKKGYTFEPDYSDAEAKITEYITLLCGEHVAIRTINSVPGPVFDFGAGFELLSVANEDSTYLSTVSTLGAGRADRFVPTAAQLAAMPNYVAVYFSGMTLVMGLADYVA